MSTAIRESSCCGGGVGGGGVGGGVSACKVVVVFPLARALAAWNLRFRLAPLGIVEIGGSGVGGYRRYGV